MPPALVAAEVAKTNAEAATQLLVQGKLQAEQNKLQAEQNAVAATQLLVQGKLQAEQNKLQAEQNVLEAAAFRAWVTWVAAAAMAAAIAVILAADYCFHESPWLVKRRMRRMLLSFELPGATAVLPLELLKVPQLPLVEQIATKPSEELRRFIATQQTRRLLTRLSFCVTFPPRAVFPRSGAHWAVGLRQGEGSAFREQPAAQAGGRRLPRRRSDLTAAPCLSAHSPPSASQSTLLVRTARALVSSTDAAGNPKVPTPTCFVSIRLQSRRQRTDEHAKGPVDEEDGAIGLFDQTATNIFRQIGAPTRRALIYNIFPSGFSISGPNLSVPVNFGFTKVHRVTQMLELLLETAAEISRERLARGVPNEAAVTVLLWDEVRARQGGCPLRAVVTCPASSILTLPALASPFLTRSCTT